MPDCKSGIGVTSCRGDKGGFLTGVPFVHSISNLIVLDVVSLFGKQFGDFTGPQTGLAQFLDDGPRVLLFCFVEFALPFF